MPPPAVSLEAIRLLKEGLNERLVTSAHAPPPADAGDGASVSLEAIRLLSPNVTELYFIGDLHGDAVCAREWVSATKLVDVEALEWIGPETGGLVFMGDYVDKGIASRATLEFVRTLTTRFPRNVAAIMGNHDLFLYLDATLDGRETRRPMGRAVATYAYSFFHPEEYVAGPEKGDFNSSVWRSYASKKASKLREPEER